MKSKTATKKSRTTAKRNDRGVPFDEMRRLMRVYGSVKCLRKRQTTSSAESTKVDSVKRKFYRWFPDLEERFEKDEEGFYRPKHGHEFEMSYREDMRTKDGKVLAKKRVTGRKQQRYGEPQINKAVNLETNQDTISPIVTGSAPVIFHPISPKRIFATGTELEHDKEPKKAEIAFKREFFNQEPIDIASSASITKPSSPLADSTTHVSLTSSTNTKQDLKQNVNHVETGIKLEIDHDHIPSAAIIVHSEPPDCSFVAETCIFDDVERSFYGHSPADCPSVTCSSCSSSSEEQEGMRAGSHEESDSHSLQDIDEILGSDNCCNNLSSYISDMISGQMDIDHECLYNM